MQATTVDALVIMTGCIVVSAREVAPWQRLTTPFDMPAYVLPGSSEAQRWEDIAIAEAVAGERADDISDRYLVFTIVFASVLFFGGISGKFEWQIVDVVLLASAPR